MKITLTSEESLRLEQAPGPMTIEAESSDRQYSPFHMLASGLALCTYSILASWATTAKLAATRLVIDVSWTFADDPHRVGTMDVSFDWPELPVNRRAAARRVAELCTVHATLMHPPAITIHAAGETAPSAAPGVAHTPAPAAGAPVGAGRS
ncbi:MAG TPA: OsmC family protein [Gemmatimonadaceae bacterium]|nr:OsmC family protein [Gemmatimonadaceae bacterium]